jgi:hypothetical protein
MLLVNLLYRNATLTALMLGVMGRTGKIRSAFDRMTQPGTALDVAVVVPIGSDNTNEDCGLTEIRTEARPKPVVRTALVDGSGVNLKPRPNVVLEVNKAQRDNRNKRNKDKNAS